MAEAKIKNSTGRKIIFAVLIVVSVAVILLALLIPVLSRAISPPPQEGDIALQDFRAPQAITYVSEVQTQQLQESAARNVLPIYTPPNTGIARQQLEGLQNVLTFITNTRVDAYANSEQKLNDLSSMDGVSLDEETAANILAFTDARWEVVEQEAVSVLERVMSSAIRQENINEVLSRVPAMVSLSLPEAQAEITAELVSSFVVPNSEYSEVLTESARQSARDAVEPVNHSYGVGQTIALRGQVLNAVDIEALEQLKLIQPQQNWEDLASVIAIVILLSAFMIWYLRSQQAEIQNELRTLIVVVILFLVFLLGARLTIPTHAVIPYAFPLAAFGLTIAALVNSELAMVFSLPLAILVAFGLPNALDLSIYYIISSVFGVLALRGAKRTISFFQAGAAIGVSGIIVTLIYRLPMPTTDLVGLATLIGAAIFYGLASASIALILQFLLAQFLDLTTPIQLMDLTRPDHPLLQMLLHDATGTYQHSLQVANLSEQAAERIGVDPLLTRVGALYHDIGKSRNPVFFIENQVPGFPNPHENLDPFTSGAMIIRHVPDGEKLARKYRLPKRVIDFIREHHGTTITNYQYAKAVSEVGGDETRVDISHFRYPGPRPQSCETAIVMLADGCEARVRAERPKDEIELRILIKNTIDDRAFNGQLDETRLTLQDLNDIIDTFTTSLRSVYHPRIKYPELGPGTVDKELEETVSGGVVLSDTEVHVEVPVDASQSNP